MSVVTQFFWGVGGVGGRLLWYFLKWGTQYMNERGLISGVES